jgi:hypothetical protein
MQTPHERLRAAVASVPRGARFPTTSGPTHGQHLVEVTAGDVLAVCDQVEHPSNVVAALSQGSRAGKPQRRVHLQADDVYHLLESAGVPAGG